MKSNYYSGCKIVIAYRPEGKSIFEKAKKRMEEHYSGIEIAGEESTECEGPIMVKSAWVPNGHSLNGAGPIDDQGRQIESWGGRLAYGFASATIDEIREEEQSV